MTRLNETELITRIEAARILNLHPMTLCAWARKKKVDLPYIRIGRKILYSKKDINDFLKRHTLQLSEPTESVA